MIEVLLSYCYNINHLDGPLAGLGEVVVHRFDLEITLKTRRAQLSTNTTHLESAKRHAGVEHAVLVAPHCPGDQVGGDSGGLFRVVGVDSRGEAIGRIVGQGQCLVFRLELANTDDGSKDLQ